MARAFAIILAGGRSARMGRDKGRLRLDGRSMLARAVDACASCDGVVVVAPVLPDDVDPRSVSLALENPPFGGPVAGIAAGLAALPAARPTDEVLLLACDLPRVGEVAALLASTTMSADGACLVDSTGYPQFLAARYRRAALTSALLDAGGSRNRSVGSVLGGLDLALIPAADIAMDVDTPSDATAAGVRLTDI